MKQKELEAMLQYWQILLGLSHWDIAVKFSSYADLEEDEGSCIPTSKRLEADIKVLDPKEYNRCSQDRPQNIEDTIVHELLHCLFPDMEDSVCLEQGIVRITRALLKEKYKEEGRGE